MKKTIVMLLGVLSCSIVAQSEKQRVVLVTGATGWRLETKAPSLIADALKALDYRVFIVGNTIRNQKNYNDSNVEQVKQLVNATKDLNPNFVLISWLERKEGRSQSVFGIRSYLEILNGDFFATKPDGELIKKWALDAEGLAATEEIARDTALVNLVNRSVPTFKEAVTPK